MSCTTDSHVVAFRPESEKHLNNVEDNQSNSSASNHESSGYENPSPQRQNRINSHNSMFLMVPFLGTGHNTPEFSRRKLTALAQHAIERGQLPKRNFTFKQFCLRMTSHGLADFAEAETLFAKIWWGLMILLSLAVLFYYASQNIYEYYTDPITTSFNYVPEPNMLFPQLYICPMHFVNWTYFLEEGMEAEKHYSQRMAVFQPHLGAILDGRDKRHVAALIKLLEAKQREETWPAEEARLKAESLQEFITKIAYKESEFIKECQFHLDHVDCEEITEPFVDKEYGLCYLVDINKASNNISALQTVPGLGLSLALDIHTELYPTRSIQPMMDGVLIRFGIPVDPLAFSGTLLYPGSFNKLTLTAKEVRLMTVNLAKTPQKCIKEGDVELKIFNLPYTLDTCRSDCVQSSIRQRCNCIQANDIRYIRPEVANSTRFCTVADLGTCVLPHVDLDSALTHSECFKSCHRPCNFWDITVSASQTKFPADNIIDTLEAMVERKLENSSRLAMEYKTNPVNFTERLAKNAIILDIAYDQLEYTSFEQHPSKTLPTLFGDIGGQVGLWTGASVFTLMQLIVFVAYLCYSNEKVQRVKNGFKESFRRSIRRQKVAIEPALNGV